MISAASILVLLFLPSETSSPLQWPPPRLPGAPQPNWEAWSGTPRPPPVPAGNPQPHGQPRLCQPRRGIGGKGGAASTTTAAPPPRDPRGLQAGKRREGKPNSLDLTFHLLREFLEMSREERLAQKALSNKLLLQSIGK
uniref:Corticotropin-releasing factor domain-containing protein n=1 Tax=Anas zonorhyncha TaxID=75864 RepID=A0A8B9UQT4_9AVES